MRPTPLQWIKLQQDLEKLQEVMDAVPPTSHPNRKIRGRILRGGGVSQEFFFEMLEKVFLKVDEDEV